MPAFKRLIMFAFLLGSSVTYAENVSSELSEGSLARKTFLNQIICDMSVNSVTSPSSADGSAWQGNYSWVTDEKQLVLLVLVRITPALLDAAVEYWAEERLDVEVEHKDIKKAKLERLFIRDKENAYLLLAKFIPTREYPKSWRVKIGPIKNNLSSVSLHGTVGSVTACETNLDNEWLDSADGPMSCLIYLQDPSDKSIEPSFSVRLANIQYAIQDATDKWIEAKEGRSVSFRVETDNVRLLSKLEDGMPWKEIEDKYVAPRIRTFSATGAASLTSFLTDLGVNIIAGLILKFF